ncbi:MAG: hypothetical protein C1O27_002487 [Chloroflexi bacterium]|jgi:hypothetical protein|nr:MAG: hypothetical protein C1O27_002487 [Chloroflexota bacterium]
MGDMRHNAIAILLLATALMLSGCVKEVEVPVEKVVTVVVTATPTATSVEPAPPPTPGIEAKVEATNKGSELDSAMKEELLELANNRDAWFLASDITTEAVEGLYGSWSVICRNETSLADYKEAVYEFVRPLVLDGLEMALKDVQEASRYYNTDVESWSPPWAYVEQTWKLGVKIVLGPARQLYVLESGAWRYHDC